MNADEGKLACPFCGGEMEASAQEDWPNPKGKAEGVALCRVCGATITIKGFSSIDGALFGVKGKLRALDDRLMPEGMTWPRWGDGEKVSIGDEFKASDFVATAIVSSVEVGNDVYVRCMRATRLLDECTHVIPDAQERIDADAEKDTCDYWGVDAITLCKDCFRKKLCDDCDLDKIRDLLRRQRELDKREKRDEHQPD